MLGRADELSNFASETNDIFLWTCTQFNPLAFFLFSPATFLARFSNTFL